MANKQTVPIEGLSWVNKQRTGQGANNSSGDSLVANDTAYSSIADMRTALAAANAGYYTTAKLDQMTHNDMIYALRIELDGGTGTAGVI
jgi:hypothetical protein